MKRKAQGAIEYLFMIAAALVIILIVVRQLRNKGSSAENTASQAESQINSTLKSMMSG
ncbi:class III signal peptide-containing protein [Thermococcus sp.]|uniref:class III signal peptide-containing protein n=1 Tax=Thermococcus sp. TaxID=35749 RepID=UPI00262BC048|nr:class III signal peptide-containing protein [Thermococcus sp.]